MLLTWWRKLWRPTPPTPREWTLRVDDTVLATLREPRLDDMFWVSVEIVPATTPADPRLSDDAFWLSDTWTLVDALTGRVATRAVASSAGLRREDHRVVLRGLDTTCQ